MGISNTIKVQYATLNHIGSSLLSLSAHHYFITALSQETFDGQSLFGEQLDDGLVGVLLLVLVVEQKWVVIGQPRVLRSHMLAFIQFGASVLDGM